MIREVKFESQDRRIKGIIEALNANGIKDIEEANAICEAAGLDPYKTCEETQPICFENAKWAYVVGCAIAIKKGCKNAADAAEAIGIGLQAFCIPGSVADDRKVGIGHGNLAAMLLRAKKLSVLLSWQVTNHSLLQKALSVLLKRLTKLDKSLSVLFLTVLVRTQLRLSQESTASHILKPKWIIIPARLRKYSARLILTDFVQRLTAMALTT